MEHESVQLAPLSMTRYDYFSSFHHKAVQIHPIFCAYARLNDLVCRGEAEAQAQGGVQQDFGVKFRRVIFRRAYRSNRVGSRRDDKMCRERETELTLRRTVTIAHVNG